MPRPDGAPGKARRRLGNLSGRFSPPAARRPERARREGQARGYLGKCAATSLADVTVAQHAITRRASFSGGSRPPASCGRSSALLPPLGEEVFHVALGIARGERVVLRLDAEARRRTEVLPGESSRPLLVELEGEWSVAGELAGPRTCRARHRTRRRQNSRTPPWASGPSVSLASCRSCRALTALPAPIRTTARMSGSFATRPSASESSPLRARLSAFRTRGRLRVITAMSAFRSKRMLEYIAPIARHDSA